MRTLIVIRFADFAHTEAERGRGHAQLRLLASKLRRIIYDRRPRIVCSDDDRAMDAADILGAELRIHTYEQSKILQAPLDDPQFGEQFLEEAVKYVLSKACGYEVIIVIGPAGLAEQLPTALADKILHRHHLIDPHKLEPGDARVIHMERRDEQIVTGRGTTS